MAVVNIQDFLAQSGFKPQNIAWDPQKKQMTLRGVPIISAATPGVTMQNGTPMAAPNVIQGALQSLTPANQPLPGGTSTVPGGQQPVRFGGPGATATLPVSNQPTTRSSTTTAPPGGLFTSPQQAAQTIMSLAGGLTPNIDEQKRQIAIEFEQKARDLLGFMNERGLVRSGMTQEGLQKLGAEEIRAIMDAQSRAQNLGLERALQAGQLSLQQRGQDIGFQTARLPFEQMTAAQKVNAALEQAGMTGFINGQPTIQARQLEADISQQNIDKALSEIDKFGQVVTQETANLLNVPVGTLSQRAKEAANDLAARQANQRQVSEITEQSLLGQIRAVDGTPEFQQFLRDRQLSRLWLDMSVPEKAAIVDEFNQSRGGSSKDRVTDAIWSKVETQGWAALSPEERRLVLGKEQNQDVVALAIDLAQGDPRMEFGEGDFGNIVQEYLGILQSGTPQGNLGGQQSNNEGLEEFLK